VVTAGVLLRLPIDVAEGAVGAHLLAAPAELLLDALPPLQPQSLFLEIGASTGFVARPLLERIAGLGRLVAIDADPQRCRTLPVIPGRAARAAADYTRLPFSSGAFDVCLANLALGEPGADGARLHEVRRVLRPGGWFLATVLLRGSFDELIDALTEACEAGELVNARQALADAQAGLFDERELGVFAAAGLAVAHVGVEERAVFFSSGADALSSPLVERVLLPSWLQGAALPSEWVARAAGALDAYLGGAGRLPVRIRTAIVTARPIS
jgi:SAM-dependent methyltransferase